MKLSGEPDADDNVGEMSDEHTVATHCYPTYHEDVFFVIWVVERESVCHPPMMSPSSFGLIVITTTTKLTTDLMFCGCKVSNNQPTLCWSTGGA